MPPQLAIAVYILVIAGLFALDRDRNIRTSKGLWIPVVWLWILGSREVSIWLVTFGMGQAETLASSTDPAGSPLDRNVYVVLLMLGLIVLLSRGPQVGRLLRANRPILLFFLYCAMSVLWSDYPAVSFKRWVKAVGDLVMVMIVLTDHDRLGAIKRLLARTAFILIPVSVLLIKYYPDMGRFYNVWTAAPVNTGVTNDKNALGGICLLFGLGVVWRILHALRERGRLHNNRSLIAQGVVLVMVLWLFWQANSMTSLACFVLASGLLAATSFVSLARKRVVVHLLVVTILAGAFFALFLDTGGGLVKTLGRDPSLTGRTEVWSEVIQMTDNPLLGAGFESFWLGTRLDKIWTKHWWHPNEAHNGYLEVYLNLGWVGVVLLTVVIVTGYRNVIGMLRRDPEVGGLLLAYFVVELIYSFTEAGFRLLNPVWILFLMGAMAVPKRLVPKTLDARDLEGKRLLQDRVPQKIVRMCPAEQTETSHFPVLSDGYSSMAGVPQRSLSQRRLFEW